MHWLGDLSSRRHWLRVRGYRRGVDRSDGYGRRLDGLLDSRLDLRRSGRVGLWRCRVGCPSMLPGGDGHAKCAGCDDAPHNTEDQAGIAEASGPRSRRARSGVGGGRQHAAARAVGARRRFKGEGGVRKLLVQALDLSNVHGNPLGRKGGDAAGAARQAGCRQRRTGRCPECRAYG
ncbi:hypothetical protein CNECB9_460003 [Cupriavidus necator]|uniref:Uncharacterized protein n=1 Tax=Cupriavidus necator TaxID=106590 RepID=A0A1K0JTR4_CUPNE|nr:hypothetical protein CNECB9_460003 [Cupriavidus necator]